MVALDLGTCECGASRRSARPRRGARGCAPGRQLARRLEPRSRALTTEVRGRLQAHRASAGHFTARTAPTCAQRRPPVGQQLAPVTGAPGARGEKKRPPPRRSRCRLYRRVQARSAASERRGRRGRAAGCALDQPHPTCGARRDTPRARCDRATRRRARGDRAAHRVPHQRRRSIPARHHRQHTAANRATVSHPRVCRSRRARRRGPRWGRRPGTSAGAACGRLSALPRRRISNGCPFPAQFQAAQPPPTPHRHGSAAFTCVESRCPRSGVDARSRPQHERSQRDPQAIPGEPRQRGGSDRYGCVVGCPGTGDLRARGAVGTAQCRVGGKIGCAAGCRGSAPEGRRAPELRRRDERNLGGSSATRAERARAARMERRPRAKRRARIRSPGVELGTGIPRGARSQRDLVPRVGVAGHAIRGRWEDAPRRSASRGCVGHDHLPRGSELPPHAAAVVELTQLERRHVHQRFRSPSRDGVAPVLSRLVSRTATPTGRDRWSRRSRSAHSALPGTRSFSATPNFARRPASQQMRAGAHGNATFSRAWVTTAQVLVGGNVHTRSWCGGCPAGRPRAPPGRGPPIAETRGRSTPARSREGRGVGEPRVQRLRGRWLQ